MKKIRYILANHLATAHKIDRLISVHDKPQRLECGNMFDKVFNVIHKDTGESFQWFFNGKKLSAYKHNNLITTYQGECRDDLVEVEYDESDTTSSEPQVYDKPIKMFADGMSGKMWANRHKGDWFDFSKEFLFSKALRELDELFEAMLLYDNKYDYKKIMAECFDLGNFMMMLSDNIRRKYEGE